MGEEPANVNATSALPDDIRESIATENVKVVAGAPAYYQNLAHGNAVAHQQAMNAVILASTGKIIESITGTSPVEGGIDIAALGQLMKGMAITPPPTAE